MDMLKAREQLGLSRREFCAALHISKDTLYNKEKGRTQWTATELVAAPIMINRYLRARHDRNMDILTDLSTRSMKYLQH